MTISEREIIPVPQVEARVSIPKQNLRVPGPTPIPEEVMEAQAAQMINHRGPEFSAIMKRVTLRLQYFFQTTSPVMTFAASGTGGQECAVVNLFSPGDHVVSITIGSFGNRLAKIAEIYGVKVTRIEFPWGEAADPTVVEGRLRDLAPYKGVLVTHNETSTGVTNDIQALGALIRRLTPEALIVVDAVSSLGCVPLEMDQWDLDVVFTGSQKGWMTPPGLVMVAAGPRALEANKSAKLPRFYFDWGLSLKKMKVWQHPTTPPVSIFYALDQGIEMMLAEGRQNIFARHLQAGEYVRQRAKNIGLELLADHAYASNTVTAVKLPESVDGKGLLKKIRESDGIVFAGGQEHLEGKIFRVGHLGFFSEKDLKEAMDVMEKRLPEFGFTR